MVEEAVPPERRPAGRAVQLRASGPTPSGRPGRRPGSGPPPRRPGTGTLLKCVSQAIAVTDARCHADGGLTQCRRRRLYQDKVQIEPNEIVTVVADPHDALYAQEQSIAVALPQYGDVVYRVQLASEARTHGEKLIARQAQGAGGGGSPRSFTRFVVQPVRSGVLEVEVSMLGPLHMTCAELVQDGGANAVYLADVKDGGLAHRHGASAGDQLLSVGGTAVGQIPFGSLMLTINNAARPLKFTVRKYQQGAASAPASAALAYGALPRSQRLRGGAQETPVVVGQEMTPLASNEMQRGGGAAGLQRTVTFTPAAPPAAGGGDHLVKTVSVKTGDLEQAMIVAETRDDARITGRIGRQTAANTYAFDFALPGASGVVLADKTARSQRKIKSGSVATLAGVIFFISAFAVWHGAQPSSRILPPKRRLCMLAPDPPCAFASRLRYLLM